MAESIQVASSSNLEFVTDLTAYQKITHDFLGFVAAGEFRGGRHSAARQPSLLGKAHPVRAWHFHPSIHPLMTKVGERMVYRYQFFGRLIKKN
ncbi:hypothetical protein [Haloferula sp.]|uniref:hypothetical protein n=1 Tax=Haloferula sp. TaxID=2497595 RepID=UPI0032A071C9